MTEYINREYVLDRFEKLKNEADSLQDKLYLDGVMAVIDCIPAVDVVSVVRCKDCKYSEDTHNGYDCYLCHFDGNNWNKAEHYCSYGERKTNE